MTGSTGKKESHPTGLLIGLSMGAWLGWRTALLVALLAGWWLRFRPSAAATLCAITRRG